MHPKIKVKQGTVIGGEGVLPNGNRYSYFKGIPYAVPPLGKLRFKATVPLERFQTEEINCTKEGNIPCQLNGYSQKMMGSEDCLFLNVFSPQVQTSGLLPVMVFIHGGAFIAGSGNSDFYNPLYLMQEGVVVVTFNYRLGIFGFLSFPEGNIPGNAGIKDQRLALQWVHENISQFNGDPNNVTLFGASAGSSCTHVHVLSKSTRHFFQKAIMQSGALTMGWAWDKSPAGKTFNLAKFLGCPSSDPLQIVEFLQNYPRLDDLVKPLIPEWTIDSYKYGRPVPCLPVIEKNSPEAVLTQELVDSMGETDSIEMPLMVGYNSSEGILMLPCVSEKLDYYDSHLDAFIDVYLELTLTDEEKSEIADKIRDFYFQGQTLSTSNLQSFCNLLSDYYFISSAHELAEMHAKTQSKSPLFFYRFSVDESLNVFKRKLKMGRMKGASHVDDVFYIFQSKTCPEPWDVNARNIVLRMCKLWTNFAKYGNPTPRKDGSLIDCIWEPIMPSGEVSPVLNALNIDRDLRMIKNPDGKRVEFWRKIKQEYTKV